MKFIKNAWYGVGVSQLIKQGEMLERRICEENILFYRRSDGTPVALRNRCPHRFAPLSRGRLDGNIVTCGYHGLQFDEGGKCVHNPHGDGIIPRIATVRSYPVLDRHGLTWIWMGAEELADANSLPDLSPLDNAPRTATCQGTFPSPLSYLLQQDNLMDFSHVDHLHTWFDTGGLSTAKPLVTESDRSVSTLWQWQADAAFGLQKNFVAPGPVDSYLECIWHAPSIIVNIMHSVPRGRPREEAKEAYAVHVLTPETARSIHYTYSLTRNFVQNDHHLTKQTEEALLQVNATEDFPMVQSVQNEMGDEDFWSLRPVLLYHDGGPVKVRRAIDRIINEEEKESTRSKQRSQVVGNP
jgi:phenylpropionate dioxygenase-like ring-hydroxylating dioxygenase large terminal subunit